MSWLDVVLPAECAGCGVRGAPGCASCLAVLAGGALPAWPRPVPSGLPPPWSVAPYVDPCRALLIAYKERGVTGLRAALAHALAASVVAAWHDAMMAGLDRAPVRVFLVPVPSAPRSVRVRGDDVVLGLTRRAAAIARRRGADVRVVPALRHGRTVADSAGLSALARAANLADAFVVRPQVRESIAGATVILTDDLITTGVSLAESARALRGCGVIVAGAATVAATQRRDHNAVADRSAIGSTVEQIGVGV